jgi:hypothetical protein
MPLVALQQLVHDVWDQQILVWGAAFELDAGTGIPWGVGRLLVRVRSWGGLHNMERHSGGQTARQAQQTSCWMVVAASGTGMGTAVENAAAGVLYPGKAREAGMPCHLCVLALYPS